MRRLIPLVLLAAAAAGCATLKEEADKMTGGRFSETMSKVDMEKVGKAAVALRKGVEDVSESEEHYIGRAVAAQVLARYKPLRDPELNAYAQRVAEAVAMASDRPSTYKGYHVQVLDAPEVNAFAAPGGFLFVTRGMIARIKSEDELACVLAHEVAHVSLKHGLKTIRAARLTEAFALLGSEAAKSYTPEQLSKLTSAFEGAVDDVVQKLIVDGYSRDKEYDADKLGARYARSAGYDPRAMKSFLERLGGAAAPGGLFKTHPKAADRVASLGAQSAPAGWTRSAERDRRFAAAAK